MYIYIYQTLCWGLVVIQETSMPPLRCVSLACWRCFHVFFFRLSDCGLLDGKATRHDVFIWQTMSCPYLCSTMWDFTGGYDFFESFWIHLDIIKSIPFRTCFSPAASGMAGTPWTTTLWGTPYRPTMHIALRWDWPHRGVRCNGQMQQVPSSQGVFKRFQSHVQHIYVLAERISLGLGILKI